MHKLSVLVGILVFVTAGAQSFAQEGEAEVGATATADTTAGPTEAAVAAETEAVPSDSVAPAEDAPGAEPPPPAEEAAPADGTPPADGTVPSDEDEEIVLPPLTWLLTVGVMAARLKNTTKFEFEMPEEGQDDPEKQTMTVTDKGWGIALNIVGFYRWITIASVSWFLPEINNAINFGGVLQVVGQIPTGTIVRPTIGIGLFYQLVHVNWEPFRTGSTGKNDSIKTWGGGDFDHMTVHVRSLTPLPEIGLFIKLPLYNWWIKPYYSYWHTFNSGYAKNTGGRVDVFRNNNEGFHDMYQVDDPVMVVGGPSDPAKLQFNETFSSSITSHMLGASFNIDWNYVVSLMGMYSWNVTKGRHSIRLIFTMFFNRYVGVAAVFDYQELTTVKNIAGYFGPCFLFMTKGFMDAVDKKREKATRDKEKAKDAARQAQAAAEGGDEGEWGDDADWGDEPEAEEAPAGPEAPAEEAPAEGAAGPAAPAPAE